MSRVMVEFFIGDRVNLAPELIQLGLPALAPSRLSFGIGHCHGDRSPRS
jgi:hypothetical protein